MNNIFDTIGIKAGNLKLGKDTAVINMGTAMDCPSKLLGICDVTNRKLVCYAYKAERMYPSVIQYRERQRWYWRSTSVASIVSDIYEFISRKGNIKYLRFNEAGDFYEQRDIDKLSDIAISLNERGIITYGYSARSDLNYNNIKFILRGSSFRAPNGITVVRRNISKVPDDYFICTTGCHICTECKSPNKVSNVAFIYH